MTYATTTYPASPRLHGFLKPRQIWTESEMAYLKAHYGEYAGRFGGLSELARVLHRDRKAIREKSRALGLRGDTTDLRLRAKLSQLPLLDPIREAWTAVNPRHDFPPLLQTAGGLGSALLHGMERTQSNGPGFTGRHRSGDLVADDADLGGKIISAHAPANAVLPHPDRRCEGEEEGVAA